MAGPLPCDNHPETVAAILMTDLETGNTLTLCAPCLISWAEMLVGGQGPEPDLGGGHAIGPEELADLEPEPPVPDAGPKSEPESATPPTTEAEHAATAAQESTTPGD